MHIIVYYLKLDGYSLSSCIIPYSLFSNTGIRFDDVTVDTA